MKRILVTLSALLIFAASSVISLALISGEQGETNARSQAVAKNKSVAYLVESMTCATCPITVRKIMKQVTGVEHVSVDYDTRIATVSFNPELTTIELIGAASTNAGYTATPINKIPKQGD